MATSSTKYLRIRTRIELARNASYSDPLFTQEYTEELEPTRYKRMEILAATGGTTVDLSEFGTITKLILTNRDSTNFVDTTFTNTPGGAGIDLRIPAGATETHGSTVDPTADIVVTADTAACECILEVYGTV